MFCKKCGTEQKGGQKYCPKCGTPFIDMGQEEVMNSKKESIVEIRKRTKEPVEKEQIQEQINENQTNDTRPLNPDKEKKVARIAKAGMWIIVIAIVFTFVRAGFGFSFWWYLYLIIMTAIAFSLWIIAKPDTNNKMNEGDALITKLFSWIGAIMIAILYLWGPLSSDYKGSSGSSYRYEKSSKNGDSDRVPSWLTKWKFVCEIGEGGKCVIRFNDDGSFRMSTLDDTGTPFLRHEGKYYIEGNRVYIVFIKGEKSSQTWFEIDNGQQRLYGKGGGVFKQSAF